MSCVNVNPVDAVKQVYMSTSSHRVVAKLIAMGKIWTDRIKRRVLQLNKKRKENTGKLKVKNCYSIIDVMHWLVTFCTSFLKTYQVIFILYVLNSCSCVISVMVWFILAAQVLGKETAVTCSKGTFPCGGNSTLCVEQHKQCDDHEDCPNGEDEAYEHCGESLCQGHKVNWKSFLQHICDQEV